MTRSIIVINVDIRETRVALVEGGVIAELQIERASHRGTVGNIVLGKVTRVLPGMQAAFIDVGQERSAFLHVEDLIRPDDFEAYLAGGAEEQGESFRGTGERKHAHTRSEDEDEDDDEDEASDAHAEKALNGARAAVSADDDDDDDEGSDPGDSEPAAVALGGAAKESADEDEPEDADDADDDDVRPEDEASDDDDDDAEEDDEDELEDADDELAASSGDLSSAGLNSAGLNSDLADADLDEEDDDSEREPSPLVAGSLAVSLEATTVSVERTVSLEGGLSLQGVSLEGTPLEGVVPLRADADGRRGSAEARASGGAALEPRPGREARGGSPDADRGRGGRQRDAGRGARGRGQNARGRRGRRGNNNGSGAEAKLYGGRRAVRGGKGGGRAPEGGLPPRVSRSVPITEVVKEGDEVVVQISKEPIGTKGARVTSHVSLPGRYVVYLPTVDHLGISKRIGSARERARLRQVMESLKPARGGLIVRTVAEGLTKKGLKADVGYLIRVWAEVCKRREHAKPGEALYTELDLVLKVARDLFTDEVKTIVIDDREQYARLVRFVEMFLPERVKDIELYTGSEPIFDAYGIEDEIGRALSRKVPLPSGGSLIVDQAEALTAIDVNTGRYVGKGSKDLEETALKTNLEAVEEIAYQLRFRNIGGLVILDLIDMEKHSNRDKVWRALEAALSKDKAKTTLNRISELGLIEMTRKRTRESLGRMLHEPCFYCDGTGQIQSKSTIAYEILRQIGRERQSLPGYSVVVNAHPAIVDFLKTEDRGALEEAERRYARRIELAQRPEYHIEQYDLQGK
ncbi:MAG TPA: Rne/Rng family ribonuclease [Polyangiaceae bacterium]|nr:Rne/Rng family ribonuclease [Polyangiaceae bacterium]